MGLVGMFKGAAKAVGGLIEGDGEKIAKGVGQFIIGAITTIKGGGDDESPDLLDDE